jgi:hypothetical protein
VAGAAASGWGEEPLSPTMAFALRPMEEVPGLIPGGDSSFVHQERSQSGTPAASKAEMARQVCAMCWHSDCIGD